MTVKTTTKVKQKEYDADSISRHSGLVGVRKKASVYIGETNSHGLFTILREVLDNTIDEFLAGRNTELTCIMDADGSFWVTDLGTGIPCEVKQFTNEHGDPEKLNTLYVVTGLTHGGAKFDEGGAYETSRGSHGIGIKASNALSEYFHVQTFYKGKWYEIRYDDAKVSIETRESKKPPVVPHLGKTVKGTVVHYKPDLSCFEKNSKFPMKELMSWAEMASYLNGGFTIRLINKDGKEKVYYSKEGSLELLKKMIETAKANPLEGKSVYVTHSDKEVDLAVAFTDYDGTKLDGFTNGLYNSHGGLHVDQFYAALSKAIQPYRNTKHSFGVTELKEGIIGVINAKLAAPKFKTQTKEELIDTRVEEPIYASCFDTLTKFFTANKLLAKRLCDRASELKNLKNEFVNNKKALRELKSASTSRSALPHKLTMALRCKPEDRELFILEGDSASGGANSARDASFQETLALRGKILNVMRTKKGDKAFENEEVMNILKSIGFIPDVPDPMSRLRIGKIILTADADVDGPVVGSTRILCLDGTNPTIREVYDRWQTDKTPFWVYSRDQDGKLVPSLATEPKLAKVVDSLATLTLDNGAKLKCSTDHKWCINNASKTDPRVIWYNGNGFVRTQDLLPGDSINSVYFSKKKSRTSGAEYLSIENEWSCERKRTPVHQWVKAFFEPKKFKKYRKANKGVEGGAIHIHHLDHDSLNNVPENLEFLRKGSHWGLHGIEMSSEYNGSQKQKDNLEKFFNSDAGVTFKQNLGIQLTEYNRSDAHRKLTSEMNTDETQIRLQNLGKISRYYISLLYNGLSLNEQWNTYLPLGVPKWSHLISKYTREEILGFIGTYGLLSEEVRKLKKPKKNTYPTQFISKFLVVCREVIHDGNSLNRSSYDDKRSLRKVKGDPKYDTVIERMGFNSNRELVAFVKEKIRNHVVVSVKIKSCKPTPVYCLTVPETGNFMFDDGFGNGVCSSNSHINSLMLGCLFRFVPGVFQRGMVYVAKGYEFLAQTPTGNYFGSSIEEVKSQIPPKFYGYVLHIKGLGECNADALGEMVFNPSSRKLIRIKPYEKDGEVRFKALMSESISYRSTLLGLDIR